jgi:bis(5'-nucleosyl)-tetraphosphatase (symmetrical)
MNRCFAVGDLQGERIALEQLLDQVRFDPTSDRLILLGDLVNRGHDSLGTLRLVHALGASVTVLLGNHDLHLLAAAQTGRLNRKDTLGDILDAPDREPLLTWLAQQRLAYLEPDTHTLCVHAGIAPGWSLTDTLSCAAEVEAVLQGPQAGALLDALYGNEPDLWDPALQGIARWRFIVNVFTRLRMVHEDGRMDFTHKTAPDQAPSGLVPWFAFPNRASLSTPILFGHWSTLGKIHWPEANVRCIDTGCVWGGALTALELLGGDLIQLDCGPCR